MGIGFLSNKDLLSAEQVNFIQISSKTMDLYTQIIEDENGSEMKVFAAFGYDIYINEENMPTEFAALKGILEKFLIDYLPKHYEDLIIDTEARINKLIKEQNDIEQDIKEDRKKIEDLKDEIKELTDKQNSNQSKLETTKRKLKKRKEKLEKVQRQLNKI